MVRGALAYLFSFGNLAYVLKQVFGGQLDPLIAAGISSLTLIACAVLAIVYFRLPEKAPSSSGHQPLELPDSVCREYASKSRSLRRLQTVIAWIPLVLCGAIIVVFLSVGRSQLLAPADVLPFNNMNFQIDHGLQGVDSEGHLVTYDYCRDLDTMNQTELADFTIGNYGVYFRMRKRPSVETAEIMRVRLTVQSVEEAPKLQDYLAPANMEPLVWVIEIPENVHPGMKCDARLLKMKSTPGEAFKAVFSNELPHLPDALSLPFIVKITCEKECLIHYKLDVFVDAGWRSSPIEIGKDIPVAFYKTNTKLTEINGTANDPGEVAPASAPRPDRPEKPKSNDSKEPHDDAKPA